MLLLAVARSQKPLKVVKSREIVKKNRQIRESGESRSRVTCGRDSVVTVVNIVRVMDMNLCVTIMLKL